ncbi:hypothetical protein [Streptomyces violaceus]|uniref:Minor tail protein n=1 Tax=Streptomyces violaceus TaxID=1936 RepID=A0ABY9UMJ5_STRVL|nr:hypothetical protein [Streptomyces janthinus]WND24121.1 hypothetical protein RI060_43150 [Streptomyces janthinus]GGS97053.1 hypothetical protein GCM10010270_81360 [Streptomyces janthinus]
MSTAPPVRVLTRHALTGAWLSNALPVTDLEYGPELSGPGELRGTLSPRLVSSNPTLADPGTTEIYVESEGQIEWGGLIWDVRAQGNDYTIEAASWSSYLQKRYDLDGQHGGRGPYAYTDRCQVIRNIWEYAQSIADGNLGVTVDSTTSTSTIGIPSDVHYSNAWDLKSLGDQVDELVSDQGTPEYTCTTAWNTDKTAVVKRIRLGWPRLGARRKDIEFSSGVNIIEEPEEALAGDDYAQVVIGTGAGDGSAKLRQISAVRNGRLRLEAAATFPEVNGNDVLKARVEWERAWRQTLGAIEQVTIRDTPAAPFGSWQVGDDVYTRVHNAWTSYTGWCRVTGWSIKPTARGGPQAVVTLRPAAMYTYGGQ